MGRMIGAVVAGAVLWAVLWLGLNAVLPSVLPDTVVPGRPLDDVPVLAFLILYSAVLSVLAGYTTAAVGRDRAGMAVKVLAGLQLVFGIIAETANWDLLPVWYHLVFLALIVPATLFGGNLRRAPNRASPGIP